jgi:uncharacterized protein involved in exopolysaccharide biosynthesis
MTTAAPTTRDQLERALALLKRSLAYKKRAILVFLVGVLLAVPFVFTRPRLYKSDTVILYHETIHSADINGGEGGGSDAARRAGARLRELLMSRSSLEPIIVDMHLFAKKGKTLDRRELTEAVDDMRKHIKFTAREGDTFEVSFQGSTAAEAQEVTRRLGEMIVQEASTRRSESAKVLKEFLDKESEQQSAELRGLEAELAQFAALHPALAARLSNPQGTTAATGTPMAPAPTSSDPILAGLEARAARIDRQLRAAAAGSNAPPPKPLVPPFVPPPESAELVAARRDLADKEARFTDKHPDVVAARARVKAAEAAQAQTVATAEAAYAATVASAKAAAQDETPPKTAADEAALRQQLIDVQNQIAARRGVTLKAVGRDGGTTPAAVDIPGGEVGLEVEFRRLQREVNEARERQRQLDQKVFKASITASSVMNDRNVQVTVLDPAYLPPAPMSLSRTTLLAALLFLCVVLSFGTALVSAYLDDRIYDTFDLRQFESLPVVGVIPRAPALPPKS